MIPLLAFFSPAEEPLAYGEPEWMPSPAEVARARAELERKGVVRSLARGAASAGMVPPGQAPWSWLMAGAAWVVVWPAVIASAHRYGTAALAAVVAAVDSWRFCIC